MSSSEPVKTGLMSIGEEAKPPSIVLPDPVLVFLNRAKRLETLAKGHALEGYLLLVASICRAQASIQSKLPPVTSATAAPQTSSSQPPLHIDAMTVDAVVDRTLLQLCEALGSANAPAEFKETLETIRTAQPAARQMLLQAALAGDVSGEDAAVHALAHAALQVHFARLAATLNAEAIAPVSHGNCPVCSFAPAASAVVNWPQANNIRFCTCALCASQWHVVRLKCVTCGTTAGVTYPHIEGHPDGLRAEACESCKSYVKIVYQVKDPAFEPFADDIASLDLDMVMKNDGWTRGGKNPFLLGY